MLRRPSVRYLAIGLLVLLAYSNSPNAAFYMDDQGHILESPWVSAGEWSAAGERSVTYFVWSKVHAAFGYSSRAFHGLNLLVHLIAAFVVYGTVRAVLRMIEHEQSDTLSWIAALVFACHPLCSETIHYAAQTTMLLTTLFAMLAAWAAAVAIERRSLFVAVLAVGAIGLAAYSKEPGLPHALINVALVCLLGSRRIGRPKRWAVATALVVLLCASPILMRWSGRALGQLSNPDLAFHVLTQCRMLWHYVASAILPTGLCSDHLIAPTRSWGDWFAIASALVWFGFAVFIAWRFRVGNRLFAIAAAAALAPLVLRFGYVNLEHLVEYRAYPAMPWFALLLGMAALWLHRIKGKPVVTVLALVLVSYVALARQRSNVWSSEEGLLFDVMDKYPGNIRVASQWQHGRFGEGKHEDVIAMADTVREKFDALAEMNTLSGTSRSYDMTQLLDSLIHSEQYRAFALMNTASPKAALASFDKAVAFAESLSDTEDGDVAWIDVYRTRALLRARSGDEAGAKEDVDRLLKLSPDLAGNPQLIETLLTGRAPGE